MLSERSHREAQASQRCSIFHSNRIKRGGPARFGRFVVGLVIIVASLAFFMTQPDSGAGNRSRNSKSTVQPSSSRASVNANANLPSSSSSLSPSPLVSLSSQISNSESISESGLQVPRSQKLTLLRETYADLLSDLSLGTEGSERFLELIADDWNDGESPYRSLDGESYELMALLGNERFRRYEAYQRTLEQRMVVRGLEQELAVSNIEPLGETRKNNLLELLIEEHSAIPPRRSDQLSTRDKQERIEQLEYYEQRALQRAEFLLTEAQWATLRTRLERSQHQRNGEVTSKVE